MANRMVRAVVLGAMVMLAGAALQAQSHSDKEFLQKDSQGNVAEVELAKLALKKGQSQDVRMFAQRMIKDHETLAKNMAPFLKKTGLQPSTSLDSEHQKLYNKLKALQGKEFDTEYVKAMDKDHHEDLKSFQSEVNSTKDMDLKAAVQKGEQVIAGHTKMIDELSAEMGMKPAGV